MLLRQILRVVGICAGLIVRAERICSGKMRWRDEEGGLVSRGPLERDQVWVVWWSGCLEKDYWVDDVWVREQRTGG